MVFGNFLLGLADSRLTYSDRNVITPSACKSKVVTKSFLGGDEYPEGFLSCMGKISDNTNLRDSVIP